MIPTAVLYGNLITPVPTEGDDTIEDMSYAMIVEAAHREADRLDAVMFGPPELHVVDEMHFLVWGMVGNG